MHFFSADYLRELLGGWPELHLGSVQIPHRETGEPFKHVWRGIVAVTTHRPLAQVALRRCSHAKTRSPTMSPP